MVTIFEKKFFFNTTQLERDTHESSHCSVGQSETATGKCVGNAHVSGLGEMGFAKKRCANWHLRYDF